MVTIKREIKIQNIDNPKANAYRNMRRSKVDKFFSIKSISRGKKRKKFDFLARQLWRKTILQSNKIQND